MTRDDGTPNCGDKSHVRAPPDVRAVNPKTEKARESVPQGAKRPTCSAPTLSAQENNASHTRGLSPLTKCGARLFQYVSHLLLTTTMFFWTYITPSPQF